MLLRALRGKEAHYGKDHLQVAITLSNLSSVHGIFVQPVAEKGALRISRTFIPPFPLESDNTGSADKVAPSISDNTTLQAQHAASPSDVARTHDRQLERLFDEANRPRLRTLSRSFEWAKRLVGFVKPQDVRFSFSTAFSGIGCPEPACRHGHRTRPSSR